MAAAQLIHAAGESAAGVEPHTFAVALAVPSELALRALSARLSMAGVAHKLIIEDDAPYHGQAMALGIAPARRSVLKRFVSSLPLYRGPAM